MRKDNVEPARLDGDYKSGCRVGRPNKQVPSKLKIGTKGINSIVKPIK